MTELAIDRPAVLSAVERVGARTAEVIAAIRDPLAPTRGLSWSLVETAGHVALGVRDHRAWVRGDGGPHYGAPDLAAENRRRIEELGERDPARLAAMVGEGTAALAREAAAQPPGITRPAAVGPPLSIEVMLCVHLGELLVHGFDLARTLDRPWPMAPAEANLVAAGGLTILPQFVDPARARAAQVAYELRLRHGGPRAVVRISRGTLTVEAGRPGTPVDCHISADPVSFLLISYGRIGQAGPALRGRMLAWGRRPWAALRLSGYIRNP